MEPEKTDQNPTNNPTQDQLIKAAEAAAEQASETTEKVEAQHAEQTPTTPAAPVQPAPVQPTPAPSEPPKPLIVPDSIVAPAKKKHTVRNVILIILSLLVLGCAGVAIWFFAYYNNSEKVATDALQNIFTTDNIAISTHVKASDPEASSTPLKSLDVNLIANHQLPATISFDATVEQDGRDIDLSAGLGLDRDGVMYAFVNGLPDALGLTTEIRQQAADMGEDVQTIISTIDDIDTETWRIDVPEIVAELDLDKKYSEAYTCIIGQIQHSDSAIAAQAYTEYPFLNIKDATDNSLFHNSYNLTIDSAKLTNFLNKVAKEPVSQIRHCLDGIDGITVSDKVSESEVEAVVGELPAINIKVDWLSHQLTTLSANDDAYTLSASFTYPEQADFNPPTEYRSATELLDEFTDVVSIYLNGFATATTEVDFNCTTDTMNCTKSYSWEETYCGPDNNFATCID